MKCSQEESVPENAKKFPIKQQFPIGLIPSKTKIENAHMVFEERHRYTIKKGIID